MEALQVLAPHSIACSHPRCGYQILRDRPLTSIRLHSELAVVDARTVSRYCPKCRTLFGFGVTTYTKAFYNSEVHRWIRSAILVTNEELADVTHVRGYFLQDGLVRISTHHLVKASLARSWFLTATLSGSPTSGQVDFRHGSGSFAALLTGMDEFTGSAAGVGWNDLIWSCIVFFCSIFV